MPNTGFWKAFTKPGWKRGLALGLAGGCLLNLLLLGVGSLFLFWGRQLAKPATTFCLQDIPQAGQIQRRGSRRLAKGWVLVIHPGQDEIWRCLVRVDRHGGEETRQVLKRLRWLRRGQPMQVMVGSGQQENPVHLARVSLVRRVLTVVATAYDPGPVDPVRGFVGTTSIGERARFGVVAVDPRVIPYRSRLYIEGYGPGLAADTGGAIKGLRVDLCYNSTREARVWGRRKAKVFILEPLGKARGAEVLKRLNLEP